MKINVKQTGGGLHMEAKNEEGNTLFMDASKEAGGQGTGMRPMELLLSAIGGCTSIDVLLILKKQKQQVTSFEIDVEGEREKVEEYSLIKKIVLHFKVQGTAERHKIEKAIALSLEKYCSVAKTLEPTATITHTLTLNNL